MTASPSQVQPLLLKFKTVHARPLLFSTQSLDSPSRLPFFLYYPDYPLRAIFSQNGCYPDQDCRGVQDQGHRRPRPRHRRLLRHMVRSLQGRLPLLEKLSDTHSSVDFYKVDVDELASVAAENGVSAMPTFHFYNKGERVQEVKGANPPAIQAGVQALLQ
ncbi:hypothetical protein N7499_006029 [Penicillium canescens]|uniref:uncharacterized protein n=1 Tax=Penicillium canescens TaxID=5083 RepID=UPI0026E10A93|nr:uncharacterized protein N7446_001802 [Penicillium canescens]KAJ6055077.1 hypothetical protein N7444_004175 [Penicillium canescens]KAJ6074025.1 hypothetical protein N7446_001802 [Penicillium canescens]KAJ6081155.1 hypothetical protein N7499_006029 [Penicillium canescens]